MSNFTEFFLNSSSKIVLYETIEISHSSFSKVYRIVRNARFGIYATVEGEGSPVPFDYYPLKIEKTNSNGTLDQSFRITVGDLGSIIHTEIDNIEADDSFSEKPLVIYRAYRSDNLVTPIYGPFKLEITTIPINNEGFTFEAKPYQVNQNLTGEIYTINRFPGLRGFL